MNKYAGINIKYHQMSKLFQIRVSKFYDFIYHLQTSSGKRPQRDLETMLKWCDHFGLVWLTNEKLTGWLVRVWYPWGRAKRAPEKTRPESLWQSGPIYTI